MHGSEGINIILTEPYQIAQSRHSSKSLATLCVNSTGGSKVQCKVRVLHAKNNVFKSKSTKIAVDTFDTN